MNSPAKGKQLIIVGYVVAGLLLIAAAVFVTMLYLNANKPKPVASTKPKIAQPAVVQSGLKSANDAAKKAYDLHSSAEQAVNEKQVKLSE